VECARAVPSNLQRRSDYRNARPGADHRNARPGVDTGTGASTDPAVHTQSLAEIGRFDERFLRASVALKVRLAEGGGSGTILFRPFNRKNDATVHFEFDPIGRSLAVGLVQGQSVQSMRTVFENLPDGMFLTPFVALNPPKPGPGLSPTVRLIIESEDE
jgi:hypothetical protein